MSHHYNAVEVLELVLAVWVVGPVVVLVWVAGPALIDPFKRLFVLWKERLDHTIVIYRHYRHH